MQKILLQCHTSDEADRMRLTLEKRLPYPVHVSLDPKSTFSIIQNKTIHLLAYETQEFGKKEWVFTKELKKAGFNAPTLIVADVTHFDHFFEKDDHKLFFLRKPFDEQALVGVTRKLMVSRSLTQQRHKRFNTQQSALLETFMSGESLPSQIYNLSVGGAYCEFFGKSNVAVGDLVKLKVQLDDVGRYHVINAKIVWITRNGSRTGGPGAGMKFVKYDDIYRQLMEKV